MISLGLALLGCGCGALAAYYWYRSATVSVMPTWAGEGPNPMMEPVIKTLSQDGWISGTVKSITDAAHWNKRGAAWSAVAVVLSGLSSLAGALS